MFIKQITDQNRRDFTAIYQCENCGYEKTSGGYDDRNFHDNVVPNFVCEKCGESTVSLGLTPASRPTKYPEEFQV